MNFPKHRLTAGALVRNNYGEILLIKSPSRGWELPGGHVEEGESIENALIREVKEETGIDIKGIRFCGITQEVSKSICNTWWLASAVNNNTRTSQESVEVKFVSEQMAISMITNLDFKEELNLLLNEGMHPFSKSFS